MIIKYKGFTSETFKVQIGFKELTMIFINYETIYSENINNNDSLSNYNG